MADGSSRPIEQIRVGDRVLAYDTEAVRIVDAPVEKTFVHAETKEGIVVINGILRATAGHPFYVGGRWVSASDLQVGDRLFRLPSDGERLMSGAEGEEIAVRTLQVQAASGPVYNLEVSGQHNYFAEGLLVHNKPLLCSGSGTPL